MLESLFLYKGSLLLQGAPYISSVLQILMHVFNFYLSSPFPVQWNLCLKTLLKFITSVQSSPLKAE